MPAFDGAAFGREIVDVVRGYLAKETAGIIARIETLEKRQPERGPQGERGEKGSDGHSGRDGIDGKEGPAGKDGAPGRDGIDGKNGIDGKDGRDGIDGKDGAPGLNGKDGRDGIDGKDGSPGARGDKGDSGIDGKDGRDGSPGRDGQAGLPGRDGKDGKDGIDFADLNEFYEDDGRILVRQWLSPSGEIKKEFRHVTAAPLFRGIWQQRDYQRGDQVTHNGSQWIALHETKAKPGEPNSGWQLTVKRGRDGKQ